MKKNMKKIIAGILTVAVCVSTSVCAFVSCDKKDDIPLQSGLMIEEKESNGISLCVTPIATENFSEYNVAESALEAVIIEYEIFPSCATTKTLRFTTEWSQEAVERSRRRFGGNMGFVRDNFRLFVGGANGRLYRNLRS